ncbi:MAG: hypothetical protein RRZ84_05305 [Romboutsia sp.]
MKNSRQELQDAFSKLQGAQICLKHAMENVEKSNNKRQIEHTLSSVDEAVFAASNAIANYQE